MRKPDYVIPLRRQAGGSWLQGKKGFAVVLVLTCVAAFTVTLLWPVGGLPVQPVSAPNFDFECEVAHVNDGDTLRCRDGTRVRLHAIAARETDGTCSAGHPCPDSPAAESRLALERLAGSRITCLQTGTSYKRVTAICHNAGGVEINCAMVQSGAAARWDRFDRQRPICRT